MDINVQQTEKISVEKGNNFRFCETQTLKCNADETDTHTTNEYKQNRAEDRVKKKRLKNEWNKATTRMFGQKRDTDLSHCCSEFESFSFCSEIYLFLFCGKDFVFLF